MSDKIPDDPKAVEEFLEGLTKEQLDALAKALQERVAYRMGEEPGIRGITVARSNKDTLVVVSFDNWEWLKSNMDVVSGTPELTQ